MAELLPCPFCGGKADICEDTDRSLGHCWAVFCVVCDSATGYTEGPEQATQAWNKRAAAPPPAGAQQALAKLDALGDDAAVHIWPSDLEKCSRSECIVKVYSVRMGSPDGHTVPLFSRDQVAAALAAFAAPAAAQGATNFEQMRARTLLAHLWRRYDAAGTSMGRSHEAVVLEAVLSLLGDPDPADMALLDKDSGDLVNATRTYLSSKMAQRLFGGSALSATPAPEAAPSAKEDGHA